ncbi:hypothetical protein H0H92_002390 [Tricholoma furcatifolium]|nr:hypothetical protein H0H92_002390 [Tricholoma furcatifolium]
MHGMSILVPDIVAEDLGDRFSSPRAQEEISLGHAWLIPSNLQQAILDKDSVKVQDVEHAHLRQLDVVGTILKSHDKAFETVRNKSDGQEFKLCRADSGCIWASIIKFEREGVMLRGIASVGCFSQTNKIVGLSINGFSNIPSPTGASLPIITAVAVAVAEFISKRLSGARYADALRAAEQLLKTRFRIIPNPRWVGAMVDGGIESAVLYSKNSHLLSFGLVINVYNWSTDGEWSVVGWHGVNARVQHPSEISEVKALPDSPPVSSHPASAWSSQTIALTIDHTLLKPDATSTQIDTLCDEALKYRFKSCCVNGCHVAQVAKRLSGSPTIPCCVVGFPLGAGSSKSKALETHAAIEDGAKEIDMVLNIGALKSCDYAFVFSDIAAVVEAAVGHPVKVILETVFLTDEEKVAASFLAAEAGAAFIKTCTGFSGGGASIADVGLMKKTVQYKGTVKVKASAGIRSLKTCLEMLVAGADRIGT